LLSEQALRISTAVAAAIQPKVFGEAMYFDTGAVIITLILLGKYLRQSQKKDIGSNKKTDGAKAKTARIIRAALRWKYLLMMLKSATFL